jgi:RNA polymerase sigma-70 factor, ECF subfamily
VNTDDRRIIAACLSGRPEAFGDLVLRYQDRLYHSILRIVNHPEDAFDVVQDTFLNAYQSLESFKGESEFFTWLYRIGFNAAISRKRKKRAEVSLNDRNGDPIADPVDESHGHRPEDRIDQSEDEFQIRDAIEKLSVEHRSVLVMKDIDGLKYEEIASITGIPLGTVRSRLHRARLELRQHLEARDPKPSVVDPSDH